MIATSGFLTALECAKFVFGRGSVPNPAGGAYSAPPDLLAGLRGSGFKGERKEMGNGEKGRGRERESPPFRKFLDTLRNISTQNGILKDRNGTKIAQCHWQLTAASSVL